VKNNEMRSEPARQQMIQRGIDCHRGLGTIVNELIGHKGIQLQREAVAVFVVMPIGVLKVKDNDAARHASRQRTSQPRVK